MEIHAYDEEYLPYAQRVLGDMLDFAVNTCGMEADDYFFQFIVSGIATQFGNGNPKYVVGMTGCEVVPMTSRTKCIWTNPRNTGRVGRCATISGLPDIRFPISIAPFP